MQKMPLLAWDQVRILLSGLDVQVPDREVSSWMSTWNIRGGNSGEALTTRTLKILQRKDFVGRFSGEVYIPVWFSF